jgi:hypothetical protein
MESGADGNGGGCGDHGTMKFMVFLQLSHGRYTWDVPELHIPSGKFSHNYGKPPFYGCVNPLFLWPFKQ